MAEVMTYMAKIGIDGSEFTGGIESMASKFVATFGPTGIMVGAVAVTAGAIAGLIKQQGDLAKSTNDLSMATGISTDAIQRFHYAATISGDSISTVDMMLNKLTLSMGQASDATSTQAKAFNELGISVEGKTTEETFLALSKALTGMDDKQKAASISMDILGRSYKNMLPFMNDYLKNAKDISEHPVMTKEQLDKLEAGAMAYNKLGEKAAYAAGQVALVAVNILEPTTTNGVPGGTKMGPGFGGAGITAAGLYSYDAAQKTAANVKTGIIDPYAGWTAEEVKVQLQTDKVTQSQKDLATAMGKANTPENVEKVKLLSAAYKEQQEILDRLLKSTATLASATSTNPYAGNGESSGGDIGSMNGSMNSDLAASLSSTGDIWAYAFANTDSSYESSNFLAQIRAVATEAQGIQLPGGANWTNSSESGRYISNTQDLWNTYQSQKSGQTGITQINYIQGANAQDVANQIAEATSRALARQVTS